MRTNTPTLDEAVNARHRWLESIADNQTHYVINKRWHSFCAFVNLIGMDMAQFEKFLKHLNYEEYMYAQTVKSAWQEYKSV